MVRVSIACRNGIFQELFFERVKIWQNWQGAQQNLTRKREIKARYELSGRTDKADQTVEELNSVCFSQVIAICRVVP